MSISSGIKIQLKIHSYWISVTVVKSNDVATEVEVVVRSTVNHNNCREIAMMAVGEASRSKGWVQRGGGL